MISLILTPPDLEDVEYEDDTFKKTTYCDTIGDRVEG
jgi:hypothetical protein